MAPPKGDVYQERQRRARNSPSNFSEPSEVEEEEVVVNASIVSGGNVAAGTMHALSESDHSDSD